MDTESELKSLIATYQFLQLCKRLRQSTWQKQINDYHEKLEKAACKLAEDENYTEALCEGFEYLCKVKYERLIDKKYIKNNLKNPLNNKLVSEDTKSFVQISWKDGKMICTHKEG